ncbi:lipoprotein [Spirochaetia bacterium]|nr:lipoprotein [Spirochaetia bacterium]
MNASSFFRIFRYTTLMYRFFVGCVLSFLLASCSRSLGWGVLLWSTDKPAIPSGTVLPVYIRSNINQVWVAGIPVSYRTDSLDKMEIPLAKLELVGSERAAKQRAQDFAQFALLYAETLQDGLPIRESPDNNAKRVYRLHSGEIVKILQAASGATAVSSSGEPLPGTWYYVMTEDGSVGYCFSYRLKLFEHSGGAMGLARTAAVAEEHPNDELDRLVLTVWVPDSYSNMLTNQRIDIEALSQHYGFFPGQDTGIARIHTETVDKSFEYTAIRADGTRSWHFEGSSLQMTLRSATQLAVYYNDGSAIPAMFLFNAFSANVDDLIVQEQARREAMYQRIVAQGPLFSSMNYGTLLLNADGRFTWTGYDLLIPQYISYASLGSGTVAMNLFVETNLQNTFDGALSLQCDGIGIP